MFAALGLEISKGGAIPECRGLPEGCNRKGGQAVSDAALVGSARFPRGLWSPRASSGPSPSTGWLTVCLEAR